MVKNHKLAKSRDAIWSMFRQWVDYFGKVFGKVAIAVPPYDTSCLAKSEISVTKRTGNVKD
jgi:putative transposase